MFSGAPCPDMFWRCPDMFWRLKGFLSKDNVSLSKNNGFNVNVNTLLLGAKVHSA